MCLFRKRKKVNKVDFGQTVFILESEDRREKTFNISPTFNGRNKYYHAFHEINYDIQVYVRCHYTGVNMEDLADTIASSYEGFIVKPTNSNGEEIENRYALILSSFLNIIKKWNKEIIPPDHGETEFKLNNILHAFNEDQSQDVIIVFKNEVLSKDLLDYIDKKMIAALHELNKTEE